MDYERAYVQAVIRARKRNAPVAIMRTAFRDYTFFMASDASDYAKYEVVYPDSPLICI